MNRTGPDIQAEVLAMPPIEPGHEQIREPEMRAVLREVLWIEQRKRWRALIDRRAALAVQPYHDRPAMVISP